MKNLLPLLLLALLLVLTRIFSVHHIESLAHLQPLGALFFCCIACHHTKWICIPLAAWLGTYAYTNAVQGYPWSSSIFIVLLGLLAIVGIAFLFRGKGTLQLLGGSLFAATAFYLITNTASWLINPMYAKSTGGFIQALWTGLPQYADTPTWMFFRNSLVSTAVFTALFLAARQSLALPGTTREQKRAIS